MKERASRLNAIKKLIKADKIESQDTLLKSLRTQGYAVTQATLSRDLKFLKVGKLANGSGGYSYALPTDAERQETERAYVQDFLRGYISIEWSGNMVVVKTYSGHADAIAIAIDTMGLEEVLGTLAGNDNTVFVCLREGVTGEAFLARLKENIPGLEE
jgi:transcriptional regulator of arginine metabolism